MVLSGLERSKNTFIFQIVTLATISIVDPGIVSKLRHYKKLADGHNPLSSPGEWTSLKSHNRRLQRFSGQRHSFNEMSIEFANGI